MSRAVGTGVLHPETQQVHGHLLFYPRLGKVDSYLDWRVAFALAAGNERPADFAEAALIAADAWEQVVGYVESGWQNHLLPSL